MPLSLFSRSLAFLCFALLGGSFLAAAETIPPPPKQYFNDYAGIISAATVRDLNTQLASYERTSSNQLIVAIFKRMESDSSVPDYTQRVAESWRVGQGKTDNGAVLFLFMESHDVYIQVGYGLEGALPDVLAKRIVENEIIPSFRSGNFELGMRKGVGAMIAATQGEYTGTGRTVNEAEGGRGDRRSSPLSWLFFIVILILSIFRTRHQRRGYVYGRGGMHRSSGWWIGGGGGGGFGGGGGGGFSGGGGGFGGGGAGGRW